MKHSKTPTKMTPRHSIPPSRKATSQQVPVDPNLVKMIRECEKRIKVLERDQKNLIQESENIEQKIKNRELVRAAKRAEAEPLKNY